jgi:thioredoxin
MSLLKHIHNSNEFQVLLNEITSQGRLLVIDFYADWCGPCNAIAPHFANLSSKYPHVTFAKVNVDETQDVASRFNITAMPTFVFMRGQATLARLQGGSPTALEAKIVELAGNSPSTIDAAAESSGNGDLKLPMGMMDLTPFVDKTKTECLNEQDSHTLDHALNPQGGYLASDADEQLVVNIAFNQVVKVHSLRIKAPQDKGPKTLKFFVNQPSTPDFDHCDREAGEQIIALAPKQLSGQELIPLKFVKFQKVNTISIFVSDNQEGSDCTQIHQLTLIGSPINTTNMSDFKRVVGQKGESHG